jgi:peptide/nickel transport system substrate-binding protein
MGQKKIHPRFSELAEAYRKKALSRREFLRLSALLGVSASVTASIAGLPLAKKVWASAPKRGGILRVASQIQKVAHPAQFSWIQPANIFRQVAEYLTLTGPDNITRPLLLEGWEASDDLKTWTLTLRKNVEFNNGDMFNADDVVFTMSQWLNEDTKSSLYGLIGSYLSANNIEKINDYQVKLHLNKSEIAVPEHLHHFPALVLNHRTFEGDFLRNPHGTGPYTLEKYNEGEIAILKARSDYWQKGADGKPLPYLDGMRFVDLGSDQAPLIAALKGGEVDLLDTSDNPGPAVMKAVQNDANIRIMPVSTAQTRVLRMRVDVDPWKDNRVRTALKLCQNREKILALAFQGQGVIGQDVHVHPKHPEYCPIETPKYDPAKSKKLLAEAGYPNGINIDLSVCSEWTDVVRYAEVLKEDAREGGFDISIKPMPASQYWEKWTEVALGITPWTHRPLGTMVLNLAYVAGPDGKPVAWNESRWVDPEFSELLNQANGILDAKERRNVFCKLEKIQQERGSICIAYWMNTWLCLNKRVMGVEAHPTLYMQFNNGWLNT